MYKVIKLSIVCAIVIISFTMVISVAQAQKLWGVEDYYRPEFLEYPALDNNESYFQPNLLISDSQNFAPLIAGYYQRPSRNGWLSGSGTPVNFAALLTIPAGCHHLICCPADAISYWTDFWVTQWYNPVHVMFDWCLGTSFTWEWE